MSVSGIKVEILNISGPISVTCAIHFPPILRLIVDVFKDSETKNILTTSFNTTEKPEGQ
jgi:hypothetical protein